MKRFVVAALATLAASTAHADSVLCVLHDQGGSQLIYNFRIVSDVAMREVSMAKNGTVLTHAPPRQPLWNVDLGRQAVTARYDHDPRYRLVIQNRIAKQVGKQSIANATIRSHKGLEAAGACSIKFDD